MIERLNCRQQRIAAEALRRIVAKDPSRAGTIEEEVAGIFDRVIGYQHHYDVKPCGNKVSTRGIPHRAECDNCPLEGEVGRFAGF